MSEIQSKEHSLNQTEVNYGLISVAEKRDSFPAPGAEIVVYDDEGRKYSTKMHSTAPRIDGLTEWHKRHNTKIGDVVIITINSDQSVKLSLRNVNSTSSRHSEDAVKSENPNVGNAIEITKLRELQNHFETTRVNTEEAKNLYTECEKITKQFQQKFSIEKLHSMTLDDYVVGHGSHDSFCYWVERTTDSVGRLLPGGAGNAYNVYFSRKNNSYIIHQGNKGKVVTEDEARKQLDLIKSNLIELLKAAETKNFEKIRQISKQLPLDQHVVGKILSLYFPQKYLGLFSIRHMDEYIVSFGLLDESIKNADAFEKRELLLKFKEQDEIMKNWPNRKYTDFLYKEIRKTEPKEKSYFILRTGGGGYSDQQELKYNFKEGIPGYKQLTAAEDNGNFVYLENGLFYGKGEIGKIKSYEKEGTKYFDAQIQNYEKMEPVPLKNISTKLSISLGQSGIIKLSETDFQTITGHSNISVGASQEAVTLQQLSANILIPEETISEWVDLLEERKQLIFYGPPGTGKTFVAEKFGKYIVGNNDEIQIVQFHPSYSYEDFVEGIRPKIASGDSTSNQVEYEYNLGILKRLCQLAIENPQRKFVLLIDEINRGNIAKIFGELIHCLEYRGEEHKVMLPYTQEKFYIPNNVYFIGTMNSADRSIALVDYALRRRFCFIDFMPEEQILQSWLDKNNIMIARDEVVEFLHRINLKIREDEKLGKHFQIGHSYFMRKNLDKKKLENILKYNIIPLLEEYYFEDQDAIKEVQKIFAEIFNPPQNSVDEQTNASATANET